MYENLYKGKGLLQWHITGTYPGFKILLRDISPRMVKAWKESEFGTNDKYKSLVEVILGFELQSHILNELYTITSTN